MDELDLAIEKAENNLASQSIRKNLTGALETNPDKQAEINKLSAKSGVPTFSIDSPENEAWVKNMTRMNDLNPDELVKTHPMTAKALQNDNFAKIAHDDVENIKAVEDAFSVIGKQEKSTAEKYARSLISGAGTGLGMSVQGVGSTGEAVSNSLAKEEVTKYSPTMQTVMIGANVLGQFMGPVGEKIRKGYENFDVKPEDKTFGMNVAGGVGQIGSQILTYLATGGSYGVSAVSNFGAGAQQQADSLDNAKVEDTDTRMAAILAGGAVTSALETVQLGVLLKGIPSINKIITKLPADKIPDILKSKTALTALDIGGAGAAEYAQEFAENLAHNVIQMTYDDQAKIMDGLYEDAEVAGATGAIARSMILTITGIGKRLSTEENIRQDAENKLTNVQNLHDAALKMKTVQRDPAAIREMVESANPESRVYIDGTVAQTYFQGLDSDTKALLTEAIPDIEERIAEANMAGTDVMLNRSDYVAYIASNEGGRVLMEHVKFDRPDDLTVAQLSDPDYLQSLYDLSPKDNSPLTDVEQFREDITQKLRDTGRIGTKQIARDSVAPIASFIQTMRERGGSEDVTQSLLQGFDVQGPVAPPTSSLDITDKTINDMREYKTRTDTLFKAREKSLQTRNEKAKAKAEANGRVYVPSKGKEKGKSRHLPVLKYISKMGGVKVGSPLAGKLKVIDVTPKTAPWLFRKADQKIATANGVQTIKALEDVDTISADDLNETIGLDVFRNNGNYVDVQDLMDAIDSELRGNPVVPENNDPMEAAFEDFSTYLGELGIDLETATNEQVKKALKNPADFLGENVTGENVADGTTFNQPAYHGSPHKFDKFTLDHIGSGEGAQAYGWGLYFAGRKEVAEYYREELTSGNMKIDGEDFKPRNYAITQIIVEAAGDKKKMLSGLQDYVEKYDPKNSPRGAENPYAFRQDAQTIIDAINADQFDNDNGKGQLYEVEIPEDDVLLHWDKKLKDQPEFVQKALAGIDERFNPKRIVYEPDMRGIQIYESLASMLSSEQNAEKGWTSVSNDTEETTWSGHKKASIALNNVGIKGTKFLDGSSRKKGEGSYNYVIFDDEAIKTLQTYYQDNRGQVSIMRDGRYVVRLFGSSNLSTFLHETGHVFLDAYNRYASAADAPKQFTDDMAGILDYLGVKSYAEIGVAQHEKFARAFENYLRSGEAPSVALQSSFQKFKAWLGRIYQTVQELSAPVTPELKAIFDRMLATDEEIAQVQSRNDGFKINEDLIAILPKADQERYERLHNKSLEEAKENLFKKVLKEKEREHTKWWKEERASVRAEIEAQVNTDPLYRTIEFLTKGKYLAGDDWVEMPPIKISREDGINIVGKTIMSDMPKGLFSKSGISADSISQLMGYMVGNGEQGYRYGTGYELLYAISNSEDRKTRIERLTNETMVERHGDMMTDGTIEKQAIEAWNTDSQALKMELEGKAAAKLAGLPFGSNTNFELAAQKILSSKNIRDATNVDRFYIASVRAAKAYGKAIRSKDYPVAVKAKQQQLLSHHLYKQAIQARRELDKSMLEWKKLQKPDEKLSKSIDLNYIYVARAILGRYGVLPFNAGNLQTYFAYIQQDNPEAYNDLVLAVQENTKNVPEANVNFVLKDDNGRTSGRFVPWTKMSLEEFLGLKDTIDNILGVGRDQKTITIDGQKVQREEVLKELGDRLSELPATSIADGQQKALQWHDKGKLALSGIRAGMRRVENWVTVMDGEYGGVFRKYVWNPINDARGNYLEAKHDYLTKMAELLKPYDDRLNNSGEIFSPEINYTFHSRSELIGMVLHMGNESNWYKLWKGGRGREWNPANVQAMMERMMNDGTINKADMELVQSMWNLVDGLKPAAQKAHKSMYGYYFSEITSWPVPTPWGEYKGGYWPAIPDNNLSQDARIRQGSEDLITVNNSAMFPTTGRGFTKSRSEGYAAPLSFDLKLLPSHVDKVLRFVYLEPAVKDVAKLMNDKGFRKTMDVVDPRAIEEMLIPWLQRVARQTVETNDSKWFKYFDPAARWLRSSTSAQAMMLNFLNAIQQVTGFAPAIYKVGARPMGRALVQYMKSPRGAHEKIYEASSFMRYRNTILADNMQKAVIDVVLNTSKYGKVKDAAQAHGYIFQKIFQSWVDNTTWMAAYDNALIKNMNEKEAVRFADSTVRETQGSTAAEDISKFEAGPATMRLFTMFYSYFNTQANLITTEAQNIVRSSNGFDATKKLGYLYMMTYAVPSFMAELIVRGMKGDLPDDEDDDGDVIDDWMSWYFGSQIRYGTAMVPFIGQVANSAINAFDDKPYNDKIQLSPVIGMAETLARTPKTVYQAVADDGDVSRAVKDTLTSLGFITGLPLGQFGKPLGYAADLAEGDTEIDSPLDPIRGIIAGTPPADKR